MGQSADRLPSVAVIQASSIPRVRRVHMRRFFFMSLAGVLLFGIAWLTWSAEKEPPKEPTTPPAKESVKPPAKEPPKESAKEAAPPTYVGNEVCQACHAPSFEKFSTTVMGKIFLHNP